jgi:two-component system LytT family response regulator
MLMKAFLIDDEPLAIRRLASQIGVHSGIEIIGSSSDPNCALDEVRRLRPDVLFLDIEMPGISGFQFLERLGMPQPVVIFTTAYDRYALQAFKVNSVDYLLKPIEASQLARAVAKLERMMRGMEARGNVDALLRQMREAVKENKPRYLVRVPSRVGNRIELIHVTNVSYFYAKDKLTFAATGKKEYPLDISISELERRLPIQQWVRIHRSTLLNIDAVQELRSWFSGRLLVKLKDGKTELQVARERVADVRAKLGLKA